LIGLPGGRINSTSERDARLERIETGTSASIVENLVEVNETSPPEFLIKSIKSSYLLE